MTLFPIPLSFIFFYYSTRKLTLGRLSSIAGVFFYAVCPVSFALLLSPGQQWFYAFLPIVLTKSVVYIRTILISDKLQVYPIIILSILYAGALGFMPQGILLIIPSILVLIFYLLVKDHNNLGQKIKRILRSGVLVCILSFILLLPFSASFLLPYFAFFNSGKFVNDPFQPPRSLLYEDTKLYNSIRLAGIGDYHIGELGYNEITNPINILGLILCGSMIIIPLTIIYKDKYRHKLVQINSSNPLKFDFLLIVMIILLVGVIVIELGRNGLLWQIPLSSILRNPIKPMTLVAVSLGFLVSYVIFLVRYFVNFKSESAWLLFVTIIGSSIIYRHRYFDGTGWIGPVSKYWKSQGFNTAFTDSLVTKSMKDIAQFARGAYIADGEPFRFFIFPLMPSQMEFFRYNLPLVVGDQLGSLESEKRYVDYVDKVNGLVISGDNRSAISLMPLRGKYMAILPDANSAVYTGQPAQMGRDKRCSHR